MSTELKEFTTTPTLTFDPAPQLGACVSSGAGGSAAYG